MLNPANRRVRTRTHGGVGGEEPRGSPLSRFQERARPPNLVRDLAAPKFLGDETNVRRSRRTVNRSATPPAIRAFCGVNPKTRHSRCSLSSQRTDPLSKLTK